jgi:hypothetical protein
MHGTASLTRFALGRQAQCLAATFLESNTLEFKQIGLSRSWIKPVGWSVKSGGKSWTSGDTLIAFFDRRLECCIVRRFSDIRRKVFGIEHLADFDGVAVRRGNPLDPFDRFFFG